MYEYGSYCTMRWYPDSPYNSYDETPNYDFLRGDTGYSTEYGNYSRYSYSYDYDED